MKFVKSLLIGIVLIGIVIWSIWLTKYSPQPIRFSTPTISERKNHDLAQAHLFFEGSEVPPMYCTVKEGIISIKAAPVPSNQTSAQFATIRMEWRDKNGNPIYRLTRTIPLTAEAINTQPEFPQNMKWQEETIK